MRKLKICAKLKHEKNYLRPRGTLRRIFFHTSEREIAAGIVFNLEGEQDPSTHPTIRPTFVERSRSEMKRM